MALVNRKTAGSFNTFLIALDAHKPGKRLWTVAANNTDTVTELFEGSPVVFDGRVYIAAVRFEGGGAVTRIACFDAESGAPRWRQSVDVCDVQGGENAKPRRRHHLLTRAGSRVVYCSHAGAVVALEAETGRRAWAVRYPSRGRKTDEGETSPRGLAPPLFAAGRVFVAPMDYSKVLCLEPETGKTLWESEPAIEVVDLLGVADGQLIATTPGGIRALEIDTGKSRRDWLFPADGTRLPPCGRGLIAAGWVYWPTVHGLYVLDVKSGEIVDDVTTAVKQVRGNLAAADGSLVIADAETIYAFIPPRKNLEKLRRESSAEPESNIRLFRLAVAEADAGLHVAALRNLSQIDKEATAEEKLSEVAINTLARRLRFDLFLHRAEEDRRAERWEAAAAALSRAAGAEFGVRDRLHALTTKAEVWQQAGNRAESIKAWQAVLSACAEYSSSARIQADFPVRAEVQRQAASAARQLQQGLTTEEGRTAYAPIETQAHALLKQGSSADLERLVREFPNSKAASEAFLPLARLYKKAGDLGRAADYFRRAARNGTDKKTQASALSALAHCYEAEGLWQVARNTWRRLAIEYPESASGDNNRSAREFVAEHLKSIDELRRAGEPLRQELPLTRTWEITLTDATEGMLVADRSHPDRNFFRFQSAPKPTLTCCEAADGQYCWQQTFSHPLAWLDCHGDLAIVGGTGGVHAVRLYDGSIAWEWAGASPLGGFRLESGRLCFFEDERRLVVVDAETGALIWERWAPAGRFHLPEGARFFPHYLATPRFVLLQPSGGRLWILDAATGRLLHQLETSATAWPRPPVLLANGLVWLVVDETHVAALDPQAGKFVHQITTRKPSLSGEAPRLATDGTALFLLSDHWVLERLDGQTGQSLWIKGDPDWLGRAPTTSWSAAIDGQAIYFAADNRLHARALTDARALWERPLPANVERWNITRTADHLLVYPGNRVPRSAGSRKEKLAPTWHHFPVLFFDPADGSPIQRLNFLHHQLPGAVQFVGRGMVVAAGGKAWGLAMK
jgi:outer membrane protein assembly factor BamB/TolA-binding protein